MMRNGLMSWLVGGVVAVVACFSFSSKASAGACCNMLASGYCNDQKCSSCPWSTCDPNDQCGTNGFVNCMYNGTCVLVDRACEEFCQGSCYELLSTAQDGSIDSAQPVAKDSVQQNATEDTANGSSTSLFWLLAIPALLIIPAVPVITRRRA